MTQEEREHFEGIIVKAVQSGKQETSGLVDMIMHKLEGGIETSINKNVNGKLDKMNTKIDDYIKSDLLWKDTIMPSIEIMRKMEGFYTVGSAILKTLVILGGAGGVIFAVIQYLK